MTSVCLYCGSSPGADPAFAVAAQALGAGIARSGWRLVYGAGDLGLMGEAARAAAGEGGRIMGFIPGHLVAKEVAKRDLESLVITETMHERKKLMLGNADAVVALPGGPGTLDELVEVMTWRHLGLHGKPAVLVNVGGYWDPLLALFEHMQAQGFVGPRFRAGVEVVDDAEGAVAALERALG